MLKIHVPESEVWQVFWCNHSRLKTERLVVASDEDTGTELLLTESEELYPLFLVFCKDEELYSEVCKTKEDCEDTMDDLLFEFFEKDPMPRIPTDDEDPFGSLDPVGLDDVPPDEEEEEPDEADTFTPEDAEDEVYMREDELWFAALDFLDTVFDTRGRNDIVQVYGHDTVEAMVEDLLSVCAAYDPVLFRPTIYEEKGARYYTTHPYLEEKDQDKTFLEPVQKD